MNNNSVVTDTLSKIKTVVVKIGTRVIDDETNHFNRPVMESLARDIAMLRGRGVRVIVVSSGAVGQGLRTLGICKRPKSLPLRQAYAAIGQSRLMNVYNELFLEHGITTAQVLLTSSDLDRRDSYLNARETLEHLLTIGVVPIVNENDTVSTQELKFGDNDILASLIAGKMDADVLFLLTTVDGLFTSFDPQTKKGELVEVVDLDQEALDREIQDDANEFSMGGMRSKLTAARNAASKGVLVAIANGLQQGIIGDLLSAKGRATWVMPSRKRMAAWKYYLAFAKKPSSGKILVDDGAKEALQHRGKSLLATGIRAVQGTFDRRDLVVISGLNGEPVARGLANFSSKEVEQIKGKSSKEIKEILQNPKSTVVVHRDNLALVQS
jgi:glutamate 5-kinase